jgi:alpha-galactosidase
MTKSCRTFLRSTGIAGTGLLAPRLPGLSVLAESNSMFEWNASKVQFDFEVIEGKLRQRRLMLKGSKLNAEAQSSGVEVALHCIGENSPDQGMKSAMGEPGRRLKFVTKREESQGNICRQVLIHEDEPLQLRVESIYEAVPDVSVVRRYSRVFNQGKLTVGIEFLSSAMLHGLADPQDYDHELRIHLAVNSWMSEAQWHTFRPSEMGFVENERTSWSQAHAGSIGSWSTERFLPMAMVENSRLGLTWFWQIEHNGFWYWEISNAAFRGIHADNVYAYLGGPDDLHSSAWKHLQPGESYESVPVAIGVVSGGFAEAVEALEPAQWKLLLLPD